MATQSTVQPKEKTIAIIGNPNVGKSSIFNQLTGLNQKIGNYPGVTVDKTLGFLHNSGKEFQLIDLPGTYSIFPKSEDELIALRVLTGMEEEKPDAVMVILDSCNLERSLLLATQVLDLGLPLAFVLNMKDLAEINGIKIKTHKLYEALGVPLVMTDARKSVGMEAIRSLIFEEKFGQGQRFLEISEIANQELLEKVRDKFGLQNLYQAFQYLIFADSNKLLSLKDKEWIREVCGQFHFDRQAAQIEESNRRYAKIKEILKDTISSSTAKTSKFTKNLDRFLLHPILGYLVFIGIMLLIFQAIFAWAGVPMDWIDLGFAELSSWISSYLPAGVLTDFLAEGLIPGIGGIVIFIPQIALLFGFLAFLEDTGYLSRVVFLMDRIMRPFGLHGKSVVPLISGLACAIPAVMATRTISNTKEKLITILVTPWMSCSARLPVYIIIIGLVIPAETYFGFNMQALALLGMYLLGTVATLIGAFLLNLVFEQKERSFLLTELPIYRFPRWKAVLLTMYSKSKVFVFEAGKVILSISIILWVLASYGPPATMNTLEEEKIALLEAANSEVDATEIEELYASKKLEASFIGILGKAIEPAIKPLGYDWKIGIALITSFAAREVFVATIATIYSIGGDVDNELTIREKLAQETRPDTGEKVFNLATGISLMVFYAFAMQCMSTLAVVKRETKTWKWPILQTVVMTAVAYMAALITYQILV
ncbi:ferrous iron transport protein B [Aquiflexum balticum DSM 16537]|uniref:Ferrous iron transport protein B n=1 Tax=Aquiflexum balticum DSM 16537 TaxID=758820 RepID=A0A1W2GZV9_9BACT|nr:ferrous iron transport protein B [Aquiflexum balticum]SMD42220.1 ferrous iron transport protein B [Aquiflexum balticum DSM 16537]